MRHPHVRFNMMARLLPLILLAALAGCSGPRTFTRGTLAPLPDAFACASEQLVELGYRLELVDSIGGLLQGHREITGLREAARKGASAATEVITGGLAGGSLERFDEVTVLFYTSHYPAGNTIEATATLLTLTENSREQGAPTDAAKRDARAVINTCGGWKW